MDIDFSKPIPVGEALAAAGLPAIGKLLGAVVPFPFNLAVPPLFNAVAQALNVDPAAPDAAAQVQAQVATDPDAAAQKLQTIEQAHKDMADAANEELKARLADVQNARSTEAGYVSASSPIMWAPVVISVIVVVGFYLTIAALFLLKGDLSPNQANTLNILIGIETTGYAAVIAFWIGSLSSSKNKDEALISMAKQPQVIQDPGSHVSGGVAPAKGRK